MDHSTSLTLIPDCTAIILAGGESKRMGQDKASLRLHGKTLLEHVSEQLDPLFSETWVSVRTLQQKIHLKQVCDLYSDQTPLVGLVSVLKKISTSWVFLIGCDMPWVSSRLVGYLGEQRENYDTVVPIVSGIKQPLFAFYHKKILSVLELQLQKQKLSLTQSLKSLKNNWIIEEKLQIFDPQRLSFADLDTPEDWERAKRRTC